MLDSLMHIARSATLLRLVFSLVIFGIGVASTGVADHSFILCECETTDPFTVEFPESGEKEANEISEKEAELKEIFADEMAAHQAVTVAKLAGYFQAESSARPIYFDIETPPPRS